MESVDGFTLYDDAGRFCEQTASFEIALMTAVHVNKRVAPGLWHADQSYVADGKVLDRPMISPSAKINMVANGLTPLVIKVPAGTRVRFERGAESWQAIDDGLFEFVTAHAGIVRIEFDPPFPWRQQVIEVVAHAI